MIFGYLMCLSLATWVGYLLNDDLKLLGSFTQVALDLETLVSPRHVLFLIE